MDVWKLPRNWDTPAIHLYNNAIKIHCKESVGSH